MDIGEKSGGPGAAAPGIVKKSSRWLKKYATQTQDQSAR